MPDAVGTGAASTGAYCKSNRKIRRCLRKSRLPPFRRTAKEIANLLDLSVIFVTLGTPRIQGKTEDGRFAHFLFVGRISHGFERVTGDDC
jgi:hypothetical protein